jgi:hypothetical protein
MSFYAGWREQYDRMHRSHERLEEVASGLSSFSGDDARDVFFHFFQDAFHLKDWLREDPTVEIDSEALVEASPDLRACGDLANGSKHFVLRPRDGRPGAAPTGTLHHVTIQEPGSIVTTRHEWIIEAPDQEPRMATELASAVLSAWSAALRQRGVL